MKHIKKFEEFFQGSGYGDGRPPNYTNIYPTYSEVSISNLGIHLIDGMMTRVHLDFLNDFITKIKDIRDRSSRTGSMSAEDRNMVEKLYSLHKIPFN
jgi:hypothetical protein